MPSVFVRPDGRADVVARGPDFSLVHYWAAPGSPWQAVQVAGAGTVGYVPSVFVRPDGRADVVAQGPDSSLVHYWATPGSPWHTAQVAGVQDRRSRHRRFSSAPTARRTSWCGGPATR